MNNEKKKNNRYSFFLNLLFFIISIGYLYPVILILLNSFKKKAYISKSPFSIPFSEMFFGINNYINGVEKTGFFQALGWSFFITIASVIVIVFCCSMDAWYIIRVKNLGTKIFYVLCLFSMIVPFQMVMYPLSKLSNILRLNSPLGIVIVYLGFGSGVTIFMFIGLLKSIPLEIEEAAMIDGCSPLQIFFRIVLPMMKPMYITV